LYQLLWDAARAATPYLDVKDRPVSGTGGEDEDQPRVDLPEMKAGLKFYDLSHAAIVAGWGSESGLPPAGIGAWTSILAASRRRFDERVPAVLAWYTWLMAEASAAYERYRRPLLGGEGLRNEQGENEAPRMHFLSAPDLAEALRARGYHKATDDAVDSFLRRYARVHRYCREYVPRPQRREPRSIYRVADVWAPLLLQYRA
jgi:hypothetical protein